MDSRGDTPVGIALVRDGEVPGAAKRDDYALVTDYVMGALDRAGQFDVERRLKDDPEFKRFAAPVIAAWEVPVPVEENLLRDNAGGWADLRQRVAAEGDSLDLDTGDARVAETRDQSVSASEKVSWYEVLPASWLLRVGLTAAIVVGGIAWFVVKLWQDIRR